MENLQTIDNQTHWIGAETPHHVTFKYTKNGIFPNI